MATRNRERRRAAVFGACLWAIGAVSLPAVAAEQEVTVDDQQAVAVTVYNADLALVKDQRRITLRQGENAYAFTDVSAQIRPETVDFSVPDDDSKVRVIEQYFEYDLLTPQKLLEKSLGRRIGVIRINPVTGDEVVEDGEVLSTANGLVLRVGDRIETVDFGSQTGTPFRFVFDRLPDDLRPKPTLVLDLASEISAEESAVLRYLTRGLSWSADYVAQLSMDERSLALKGWVTLVNNSGTGYRDARLQLVAGDVNIVAQQMARAAQPMMEAAGGARTMAPDMSAQGLLDFHLYTLDRPTTLRDRQTKQIALLGAPSVPVTKEYIARGNGHYYQGRAGRFERQNVQVWFEFKNDKGDGLGLPLPRGVVRMYKADSADDEQFVGEDRIDHIPDGDDIRVQVGRAFDVTIDRRQTQYRDNRSTRETYWQFESSYEIIVKNARDEGVEVKIEEPIPGDWTVIRESQPHVKEDAQTASWTVEVPAKGETTLTYSVRVVIPR